MSDYYTWVAAGFACLCVLNLIGNVLAYEPTTTGYKVALEAAVTAITIIYFPELTSFMLGVWAGLMVKDFLGQLRAKAL
jgi:hypothetical protein